MSTAAEWSKLGYGMDEWCLRYGVVLYVAEWGGWVVEGEGEVEDYSILLLGVGRGILFLDGDVRVCLKGFVMGQCHRCLQVHMIPGGILVRLEQMGVSMSLRRRGSVASSEVDLGFLVEMEVEVEEWEGLVWRCRCCGRSREGGCFVGGEQGQQNAEE